LASSRDLFNLIGALSQPAVDAANREFYGKITYPWPQMTYPTYEDPHCGTTFLNQELGDWTHTRIPRRPRIWIAGCGSNQATLTALKFPGAEILATDISTPSLAVCEKNLAQVGATNITLKEQTINDAEYAEEFDYVICTGVIHHNADPSIPLARIAAALKRDGILELAVYNYYHRILTTAYQKAMRLLFMGDREIDLDQQLDVTRDLMESFPVENTLSFYLKQEQNQSREYLADSFLQPVEHSYTVESLAALLATAGLEINLPSVYVFDKSVRMNWHLEFANEVAASHYEDLPDLVRWQVSNLLMVERSPSLVFYVQRQDSNSERKSEREVCEEFLDTKFARYNTAVKNYVGDGSGNYEFSATPIPHPSPRVPADQTARSIYKEASHGLTVREALKQLNIKPAFGLVNNLRIQLTTPHFPYLKAVQRT
jgi:SAM-dependent methyltransferase